MRMKIKYLLILVCLTISSNAQDIEMKKAFEQDLKAKNEHVTSIKCLFTQTRGLSVLSNTVDKTGDFYFERPSDMELLFHDGDYIKMDDSQFEMKVAENVTATKISGNPMLKNLSSILSACVIGDFDQMTKGFVAELESTSTEWVVTMEPQKGRVASKISQIIIRFDRNDMSLNVLNLVEKSGDYTMYAFSNKQFNTNGNK